MVPACRTEGDGFAIPQLTLHPSAAEGVMDELPGFHPALRGCLARREPRDPFCHDLVGQFSALDRTSIAPLALPVEGWNVRARQRCLRNALWDEAQIWCTYPRLVDDEMGDPAGVVIVEESGFPQKGRDAVGGSSALLMKHG